MLVELPQSVWDAALGIRGSRLSVAMCAAQTEARPCTSWLSLVDGMAAPPPSVLRRPRPRRRVTRAWTRRVRAPGRPLVRRVSTKLLSGGAAVRPRCQVPLLAASRSGRLGQQPVAPASPSAGASTRHRWLVSTE